MVYDVESGAPPSAQLVRWLRARVARLRQDSTRRVFPSQLELVSEVPAEPTTAALVSRAHAAEADDHGLRVDLLIRLLDATPADGLAYRRMALIHVRPGPTELADSDFAWWSAARCTHRLVAVEVVRTVAVTRWGWVDVPSGQRKTWARLRA